MTQPTAIELAGRLSMLVGAAVIRQILSLASVLVDCCDKGMAQCSGDKFYERDEAWADQRDMYAVAMTNSESVHIDEVFVAGRRPTVTYNDRAGVGLERKVRRYLDSPGQVLAISGPTKSGKTVLVKSVLDKTCGSDRPPIWVAGGSVRTEDEFWLAVAHDLGLYAQETAGIGSSESSSLSAEGGADVKVVNASTTATDTQSNSRERSLSRSLVLPRTVCQRLSSTKTVLVVDDFHYIERTVQTAIMRGLKPAAFEGAPIIFISVPHRAYDAIQAEVDMTMRVRFLEVPLWTKEELQFIADRGFDTLGFDVDEGVVIDFLAQASGSPHLMQEFCHRLCEGNGALHSRSHSVFLTAPARQKFYEDCAQQALAKVQFGQLMRGMRPAGRKKRRLHDGPSLDIYGLVILAIVLSGPKTPLSLTEIRQFIAEHVHTDDAPAKHEVVGTLNKIGRLASDSAVHEPVVEWNDATEEFHLVDPYFVFGARWLGGLVDEVHNETWPKAGQLHLF